MHVATLQRAVGLKPGQAARLSEHLANTFRMDQGRLPALYWVEGIITKQTPGHLDSQNYSYYRALRW